MSAMKEAAPIFRMENPFRGITRILFVRRWYH